MRASNSQNSPGDISQLIDQLDRHCLASDGSYISKSAFSELHLAREEMFRERMRYLEALVVYEEAVGMVEEYHQAISATGHGGVRDHHSLFPHVQLTCFSQAYESLEHQLVVAEAAQRLRLPLLSKNGDINNEEIEKWNAMANSSLDSASMPRFGGPPLSISNKALLGVGGVPNQFLGITPSYLSQVQLHQASISANMAEYQSSIVLEIESRLEAKCDALADIFTMDDIDSSSMSQISGARLPERVKLITEEIEREETLFLEDLYSMDRKFAEHFNVLDQILEVLIKFVKDLKLKHQHKLDDMRKDWLCKRCQAMSAKLRVLEHILLRDTYTKESVPALHRIRKYLLEATEEVSVSYNKAVTRLREYQGVDPQFDSIARQYHDTVKKLEGMQWAIHQVEMDLNHSLDQSTP